MSQWRPEASDLIVLALSLNDPFVGDSESSPIFCLTHLRQFQVRGTQVKIFVEQLLGQPTALSNYFRVALGESQQQQCTDESCRNQ